jgi:hypothetical protein
MFGDDINTLEAGVVATIATAIMLFFIHWYGVHEVIGTVGGVLYGFWCAMILVRTGFVRPV